MKGRTVFVTSYIFVVIGLTISIYLLLGSALPRVGDDPSESALRMASPQLLNELKETPTPAPTSTPTPVPPLEDQLRDALGVSGSTSQGKALFKVAQHAVVLMDYWTAIRAADASPSSSSQANSLSFVVRCAIEDGEYDMAAEAASRISGSTTQDEMRNEVIEARRIAPSVQPTSIGDRSEMACFYLQPE